MENDLNTLLQSVMSDPEQMGKIAQMAQSLMGGEQKPAEDAPRSAAADPPAPAAKLPELLDQLLTRGGKQTRAMALLTAMRPYMKPEKQEKLDRALRLARLVNVAGTVMRQYGGEGFGL